MLWKAFCLVFLLEVLNASYAWMSPYSPELGKVSAIITLNGFSMLLFFNLCSFFYRGFFFKGVFF